MGKLHNLFDLVLHEKLTVKWTDSNISDIKITSVSILSYTHLGRKKSDKRKLVNDNKLDY